MYCHLSVLFYNVSMILILQLSTIFLICLIGNFIASILPFAFPGSIISMVLLFVLLMIKALKESSINKVGDYLLNNMAFFFVPAGVGIIEYFDLLSEIWWKFLLIILVSTFTTFAVSSLVVSFIIFISNKKKKSKESK